MWFPLQWAFPLQNQLIVYGQHGQRRTALCIDDLHLPLRRPNTFSAKEGEGYASTARGLPYLTYIYIYIVHYHHQERHPFRLPLSLPLRKTARCLRSTTQKRRWSAQCPWSRPPTNVKDIQIVLRLFPVLGKKPSADHEIVEADEDLDISDASSKTFVAVASFVDSLISPGND